MLVPDESRIVPLPTVSDLLTAYSRDFFPTKSAKTQYQQGRLYLRIVQDIGAVALQDLTPARLREWRELLHARGLAPGTVRQYLETLGGPLRAAVQEYDWLEENPMGKIRRPPSPAPQVRSLSDDERRRLLAACQASRNPYLYCVVLLALVTACRRDELRVLTWSQVDLDAGVLRLVDTKNHENRACVVVGEALVQLRQLYATRRLVPWVFPSFDGTKPMSFSTAWEAARQRAGLIDFRFHDLRHTAASYMAMSGASMLELSAILGHKTLAMVKRYVHFSQPHTARVIQRMVTERLEGPASPPPATGGPA
jgi:integrase